MNKHYEPSLYFKSIKNNGISLKNYISFISDGELRDLVRRSLAYKKRLNKRALALNRIRKHHRRLRAIIYAEAEKRFDGFRSSMPWKLK